MAGALAHSPADVIRWLLIQLAQGTDPDAAGAWPISAARERDRPDETITVYDTAGRHEGRTTPDSEGQEQAGLLIRVRSTTPLAGYLKAQALSVALDQAVNQTVQVMVDGVTVATYFVPAVTRLGNVVSLGKETPSSQRSVFTVNAVVAFRQTG